MRGNGARQGKRAYALLLSLLICISLTLPAVAQTGADGGVPPEVAEESAGQSDQNQQQSPGAAGEEPAAGEESGSVPETEPPPGGEAANGEEGTSDAENVPTVETQPAEPENSEEDIMLTGAEHSLLADISFEGAIPSKGFVTTTLNYIVYVPWEGDGRVTISASPLEGNTPSISFRCGEEQTEASSDYPVSSPTYELAQGEAKTVEVVAKASAGEASTTYNFYLYRTHARLEWRMGTPELFSDADGNGDGSYQVKAELYAYAGNFNTMIYSLGFDTEVLQLADRESNRADDRITKCFTGDNGVGVDNGDYVLKPYENPVWSDNEIGILPMNLTTPGTSGGNSYIGADETGLLLGTVYFRVEAERRHLVDTNCVWLSDIDPESIGYDSEAGKLTYSKTLTNGGYVVLRDPGYSNALTYPGLFSITGLPEPSKTVPEGYPQLGNLILEAPSTQPFQRDDGVQGFDPTYTSYVLTLPKDRPTVSFRLAAAPGTSVTAEGGGETLTLTAELEDVYGQWDLEALADQQQLSITVSGADGTKRTIYTIKVVLTEGLTGELTLEPIIGTSWAEATLTLADATINAVQLDLTLPEGWTLLDRDGKPVTLTADTAMDGETLAAFTGGNGLLPAGGRVGSDGRTLTIAADSGGDAESAGAACTFTGQTALTFRVDTGTGLREETVPTGVSIRAFDVAAGNLSRDVVPTVIPSYTVTLTLDSWAPKKQTTVLCYPWDPALNGGAGGFSEMGADVSGLFPVWDTEDGQGLAGNGGGTGLYRQTAEIPQVTAGTWKICVTKPGHVEREIVISGLSADLDLSASPRTLPCGDVNGDGRITLEDYNAAASLGTLGGSAEGPNGVYDLNGDGRVTLEDVQIITAPGSLGSARQSETIDCSK